MSAQVAADLRAAADVLERDGWTREAYVTDEGCCAIGALMKVVEPATNPATDIGDLESEKYQRIGEAAKALIPIVQPDSDWKFFWDAPVTRWNDEDGRTATEVIAALRAAADRAEADQ